MLNAPRSFDRLDSEIPVKLLLDENLSPGVAVYLNQYLDVIHIRDRGLMGVRDDVVLEFALSEERITVTCNVCDFEKYAQKQGIHPGIVLLCRGGLLRQEQLDIVCDAVIALQEEMRAGRDLINRALYVESDGSMYFEDVPQLPR